MKKVILIFYLLLSSLSPGFAADKAGHDHQTDPDTIWTCAMHPQIQLPEPGQCPICFMDLIEVKKQKPGAGAASLRQIKFDERARLLARVEVTAVRRAAGTRQTRLVGKVDYDERSVGRITAWVAGRIDRLDVDYSGAVVKKGQVMAQIYSPELRTAQTELIQAQGAFNQARGSKSELVRQSSGRTLAAAKEKLKLLGLPQAQIAKILKTGKSADHINIIAPMGGIVISKDVVEGMYVKTGAPLLTIADLRHLWVILAAYESDLAQVKLGRQVEFRVEAYPGQVFQGRVAYIDPLVDPKSRTVGVRLNVENPDGRLLPGMFVQAVLQGKAAKEDDAPLVIPASAPLLTGKRALVYVEIKEGVYEGREVVLGPRAGELYEVRSGLKEGEKVVSRGSFKIDSAIQIQAGPSMMNPFTARRSAEPLPPLFASKLLLLQDLFLLLSDQAHAGDMNGSQATGAKMAAKISALAPDDLEGQQRLLWQELQMTLSADLILLAEAHDQRDLKGIYGEMATHFYQLQTGFSLPAKAQAKSGSPALRAALGQFVATYLDLQRGLAGDDEQEARAAIAKLAPQVAPLLRELERAAESSAGEDQPQQPELAAQMTELGKAGSLQDIRTAFYPLSQTLLALVGRFDLTIDQPLYKQYCPMAFDNKGATWLADSEQINNPYFGKMMLRCGEVREQLKD
ncbi:MAG: efflux RND transporter periplasmic adaptor subunit [Thermodesulfobacteriota bacterium]